MRKKITLAIFLFVAGTLFASPSSIKGTIVDATSQIPLDFVTVSLFKQGSEKPIKGVISDKNGMFNFLGVTDGNYSIRISFVGYDTVKKDFTISGVPINLGQIKLRENTKTLAEVEVIGQGTQMRFDVDKKIYNVDKALTSTGGSATDALRNIPSVKVDNEGNVSLRKDANVEVWINGKPSGLNADNRAQILQQMPAESIESIEIMTNPSAKFNPEGTAGIINLVLKKNRKAGYYGSVSSGLMYPDGGNVTPTFGANINYSSSKVDAYANVGYRAMDFKGGSKTDRFNLHDEDTLSVLNQRSTMKNAFSGLFMRAGVDFHLDSLNTIGLSTFSMAGSGHSTNNIDYLLTDKFLNPGTIMREYSRNNSGTGTRPSLNLNVDYRHDFDKKNNHNILASLSYSTHSRGGDNRYQQSDLTAPSNDITQSNTSSSKDLTFKTDYTNKFTETSRLEAGWQSIISNRLSDATAKYNANASPILPYQNKFNYDEQIHAAYLTYGDRFDKLSVQAGLRAEYFNKKSSLETALEATKNIGPQSSLQLYPSMYLSYTLPKNNELRLNYTRRVNRPRGRQVNPFRDYSDSTNISYGNFNLAPEFANSVEFNYMKTWENHSLMLSAYYHLTDSVIENVRFRNGGTMESTYMNIAKKQNTGMEITAKNQLYKFLNLTTTVNLYYEKMDSSVYFDKYNPMIKTTIPGQNNFSWSANFMANFILSKSFSGQITAEYSAPTIIAQGIESPEYQIDLGLRKTFLDRKLSVGIMAIDIFNLNKDRTKTWGTGFYQVNESYFHRRMLGLTVSYNFGNMKPKQADMKKKQSSQELNMDNGME